MITERMNKVDIMVLKQDVDTILRYLGARECIQLIREAGAGDREPAADREAETLELFHKLDSLSAFWGLKEDPRYRFPDAAVVSAAGNESDTIRKGLEEEARLLLSEAQPLLEREKKLRADKLEVEKILEEVRAFALLSLSFGQIEHLSFLSARIGRLAPGRLEELAKALERRAVIVSLSSPQEVVVLAAKKSRWAVDAELKKAQFEDMKLPASLKDPPSEIAAKLESRLSEIVLSLEKLSVDLEIFKKTRGSRIAILRKNLYLFTLIDNAKNGLAATGSTYRITGWIPRRDIRTLFLEIEKLTHKRVAIQIYEPDEDLAVKTGKSKVPVSLKHRPFLKSFESLVFAYGAPLYGTIDPTPFVAVVFVLLFAIMFGDVGQGLVGVLIGLYLKYGSAQFLKKYRKFGPIFMAVGTACVITGFLYGSFFASETALVPVTRWITKALTGQPRDRLVAILHGHGAQQIILFFGFTMAVGAVINSIGLAINIYNRFRLRDLPRALFSKTGLAGALFFWYALVMAARVAFGGKIVSLDFFFLAIFLLVLVLGEPLGRLWAGTRPIFHDGFLSFLMAGAVEILESVSYYFSSSLSFVRVAAFAMVHAVLSIIVFKLGDLLLDAPGGALLKALIVVLGNMLIIVLEGLIVAIQVVRLEYYEFFSKFFTEAGEPFKPFSLTSEGGAT